MMNTFTNEQDNILERLYSFRTRKCHLLFDSLGPDSTDQLQLDSIENGLQYMHPNTQEALRGFFKAFSKQTSKKAMTKKYFTVNLLAALDKKKFNLKSLFQDPDMLELERRLSTLKEQQQNNSNSNNLINNSSSQISNENSMIEHKTPIGNASHLEQPQLRGRTPQQPLGIINQNEKSNRQLPHNPLHSLKEKSLSQKRLTSNSSYSNAVNISNSIHGVINNTPVSSQRISPIDPQQQQPQLPPTYSQLPTTSPQYSHPVSPQYQQQQQQPFFEENIVNPMNNSNNALYNEIAQGNNVNLQQQAPEFNHYQQQQQFNMEFMEPMNPNDHLSQPQSAYNQHSPHGLHRFPTMQVNTKVYDHFGNQQNGGQKDKKTTEERELEKCTFEPRLYKPFKSIVPNEVKPRIYDYLEKQRSRYRENSHTRQNSREKSGNKRDRSLNLLIGDNTNSNLSALSPHSSYLSKSPGTRCGKLSRNASMEIFDGTSNFSQGLCSNSLIHSHSSQYIQQNPLGYSNIHKQKKDFFESASIPDMIKNKSRRQSINSQYYEQERSPSAPSSRPKTPTSSTYNFPSSKISTPKSQNSHPIQMGVFQEQPKQQNGTYPIISHHFMEQLQQNSKRQEFNLENHMEMRKRFHNAIIHKEYKPKISQRSQQQQQQQPQQPHQSYGQQSQIYQGNNNNTQQAQQQYTTPSHSYKQIHQKQQHSQSQQFQPKSLLVSQMQQQWQQQQQQQVSSSNRGQYYETEPLQDISQQQQNLQQQQQQQQVKQPTNKLSYNGAFADLQSLYNLNDPQPTFKGQSPPLSIDKENLKSNFSSVAMSEQQQQQQQQLQQQQSLGSNEPKQVYYKLRSQQIGGGNGNGSNVSSESNRQHKYNSSQYNSSQNGIQPNMFQIPLNPENMQKLNQLKGQQNPSISSSSNHNSNQVYNSNNQAPQYLHPNTQGLVRQYSLPNHGGVSSNGNTKAHQYNFSFTEREFDEMNPQSGSGLPNGLIGNY